MKDVIDFLLSQVVTRPALISDYTPGLERARRCQSSHHRHLSQPAIGRGANRCARDNGVSLPSRIQRRASRPGTRVMRSEPRDVHPSRLTPWVLIAMAMPTPLWWTFGNYVGDWLFEFLAFAAIGLIGLFALVCSVVYTVMELRTRGPWADRKS